MALRGAAGEVSANPIFINCCAELQMGRTRTRFDISTGSGYSMKFNLRELAGTLAAASVC